MTDIAAQPETVDVTAPAPDPLMAEASAVPSQIQPQVVPSVPVQGPQPQAGPPQPGQPSGPANLLPAQVVAAHPRANIFHEIMNTLGGGDKTQYTVDPQTGAMAVTKVPQTTGQLARGILAGALTGLVSGASQSSGAGARAFGDSAQAATQQRQQQDQQARQQATQDYETQQKATLQKAQIMRLNMQTAHDAFELADMEEKDIQQHIDQFKDQLENIPQDAITDQHVPADQMMKKGYNAGKVAAIPDGTSATYDANGHKTGAQTTYTIYDPTSSGPISKLVNLQEAKQYGVAPFANMDVSKLPDTATITQIAAQGINNDIATRKMMLGELNRLQTAIDPKSSPITAEQFQQKIASDPNPKVLVDAMKAYQRTAMNQSTEPDGRLDALRKVNPSAAGEIMSFVSGTGPDKFQAFKEARANREAGGKSAAEEAGKLSVENSPEAVAASAAKKKLDKEAELAAEGSPAAIATAGKKAYTESANREAARVAQLAKSAYNEDGSWNPNSLPVALVEANMDPTQLSKRTADYNTKLEQASAYSNQKYGKPFDIAKAQSDYKYATTPATQNTLKFLNSLTGPDNRSGNLKALVDISNQVTRTDFPALNDAAAWARLEAGDPAITAYHTAALEVADQAAKILQGGGSGNGTSDAKLKQASEIFDTKFNKAQIAGNANTLTSLLGNRKKEMIGDNRYLMKYFPQTGGSTTPPQGAMFQGKGNDGKMYWLGADKKILSPVQP